MFSVSTPLLLSFFLFLLFDYLFFSLFFFGLGVILHPHPQPPTPNPNPSSLDWFPLTMTFLHTVRPVMMAMVLSGSCWLSADFLFLHIFFKVAQKRWCEEKAPLYTPNILHLVHRDRFHLRPSRSFLTLPECRSRRRHPCDLGTKITYTIMVCFTRIINHYVRVCERACVSDAEYYLFSNWEVLPYLV